MTFNFIDDVKLIHGSYDDGVQYAEIILTFTAEGVQMLYEITRKNIDKPVAVVVNQKVVSMPLVQLEISSGIFSISGSFTASEQAEMMIFFYAG